MAFTEDHPKLSKSHASVGLGKYQVQMALCASLMTDALTVWCRRSWRNHFDLAEEGHECQQLLLSVNASNKLKCAPKTTKSYPIATC